MSLRFRQRKFYNATDLEQMIENAPVEYKRGYVGKTLFMAIAIGVSVACVLASINWIRTDVDMANARPINSLIEQMGSVNDFTIENNTATVAGEKKKVTSLNLNVGQLDLNNFLYAVTSVITYASRKNIDILNLNVDGPNLRFQYEGLELTDGNPIYDVDLQQTFTLMETFYAAHKLPQLDVSNTLPDGAEKRNVSIFAKDYNGNLNDFLNSELNYFKNEYQFESKTYTVVTAVGSENYMALEAPISSMKDVETARIAVSNDTLSTLKEVYDTTWKSPLQYVTYQIAPTEQESRMLMVFNSEKKDEEKAALAQQGHDYFLGIPQVLRPASYFAVGTYDSRDGEFIFGFWR